MNALVNDIISGHVLVAFSLSCLLPLHCHPCLNVVTCAFGPATSDFPVNSIIYIDVSKSKHPQYVLARALPF
jgi:hypothetical protein